MNPIRPPGSVSTVSVTVVTEALLDDDLAASNVARVAAERDRLIAALTAAGWSVGPSVTNFVLVDLGSVDRAAAAARHCCGAAWCRGPFRTRIRSPITSGSPSAAPSRTTD